MPKGTCTCKATHSLCWAPRLPGEHRDRRDRDDRCRPGPAPPSRVHRPPPRAGSLSRDPAQAILFLLEPPNLPESNVGIRKVTAFHNGALCWTQDGALDGASVPVSEQPHGEHAARVPSDPDGGDRGRAPVLGSPVPPVGQSEDRETSSRKLLKGHGRIPTA